MPEKRLSCAIKMALKLGARHLDEIQQERLLNRVKKASKINIAKLRFLLEKEIAIVNGKPKFTKLKPDELMGFVLSKYRNRLRLNELGNVVELDGEEYDLDAAYIHLLMYRNLFATKYLSPMYSKRLPNSTATIRLKNNSIGLKFGRPNRYKQSQFALFRNEQPPLRYFSEEDFDCCGCQGIYSWL